MAGERGLRGAACFNTRAADTLNALRRVAVSWLSREIVFASNIWRWDWGCAAVFESRAGSRCCWRWRQRSGWWMYSAWRGLYPCLGGDFGSIATRWRCFCGTSGIIGSVRSLRWLISAQR